MYRAGKPGRGVCGPRRFVRDEDGGATVEWLVAAAVVVFFALPVLALVNNRTQTQGQTIAVQVAETDAAVPADAGGSAAMQAGDIPEAPAAPAGAPGADMGIGYAAGEAKRPYTRRISDLARAADRGQPRAATLAGGSRFYTGPLGAGPAGDAVTRVVEARSTQDPAGAPAAGQTPIPGCATATAAAFGAKFVPLAADAVPQPVTGPGR